MFSDIRRVRKYIGGTWYYIIDHGGSGGFGGPVTYWTQTVPDGVYEELLSTETYPNNQPAQK
jgi:hypothetical protein